MTAREEAAWDAIDEALGELARADANYVKEWRLVLGARVAAAHQEEEHRRAFEARIAARARLEQLISEAEKKAPRP